MQSELLEPTTTTHMPEATRTHKTTHLKDLTRARTKCDKHQHDKKHTDKFGALMAGAKNTCNPVNCEQVSRQAWERFDASRCTCCRQVWLLLDQPRRQVGSDGWRWGIWRRGPCGGSAQNFHGRDGVRWVAREKLWSGRRGAPARCLAKFRFV